MTRTRPERSRPGVPGFVDAQLAAWFPAAVDGVAAGLDALDDAAEAAAGRRSPSCRGIGRTPLLTAVETEPFFELLLQLSIDGFLCDPRHGGNRDLVGWRLIGYPA